jgi:DNA-binding response OmpR family regulator
MYIAVLEDEETLAEEVRRCLETNGHRVEIFQDGAELSRIIRRDTFDLFVLDWNVPKMNGLEVLKFLRNDLKLLEPIIFLTSTGDETAIVTALSAGADDYCVKPLRASEFIARVQALERRTGKVATSPTQTKVIANFTFNSIAQTVAYEDVLIQLSEKEFNLALFLFCNLDRPISRNRILMEIWERSDEELSRSLDVHVAWIRKKLNIGATGTSVRLTAIYGYGYRLMQILKEE